jgi:transposase-like protein
MRRSKEQMYPLVASYERGDVSKQDLCQEQKLQEGTFWYWVRKYRSEQEGGFIELVDSEVTDIGIEVILGEGVVRFSRRPPTNYLRELLLG